MLTLPLICAFLAIFGLGSVLVCWAVDRRFPMKTTTKGGTR